MLPFSVIVKVGGSVSIVNVFSVVLPALSTAITTCSPSLHTACGAVNVKFSFCPFPTNGTGLFLEYLTPSIVTVFKYLSNAEILTHEFVKSFSIP